MSLRRGERVGRYEIVEPVGAGGMGEVFKGRDTRLDRTVAIKLTGAQHSERFDGGSEAFESADGAWLFFTKPNVRGLWRMPSSGGPAEQIAPDARESQVAAGARHVYYAADGKLYRIPVSGGKSTFVLEFDQRARPDGGPTSMSVPRDESFVITRPFPDFNAVLMMIEGFR